MSNPFERALREAIKQASCCGVGRDAFHHRVRSRWPQSAATDEADDLDAVSGLQHVLGELALGNDLLIYLHGKAPRRELEIGDQVLNRGTVCDLTRRPVQLNAEV